MKIKRKPDIKTITSGFYILFAFYGKAVKNQKIQTIFFSKKTFKKVLHVYA